MSKDLINNTQDILHEESNFDRITDKHGKYICGAPWTSFSFEPDGDIAFCCATGFELRDLRQGLTSLDEIINSPQAKQVRADLLKGYKTEYCEVCWDSEDRYGKPSENRVFCIEKSHRTIDELIKHTDSNGYMHKQAPTWFDIMFSNKCNFACMGCNMGNSTTIGKYITAYDIRDGLFPDWHMNKNTHMPRSPFTEDECFESKVDATRLIDYIIEHKDTINDIHFQGGEPFMMPEVYQTLDRLIENNLHDRTAGVHIWCHTNGSIRTYKGEDIIEKYLSKWERRFHITMSHDGYGPRGEYIRYGYTDKKWIDTYNRLIDVNCKVNIQHSINIFNILHQKECLEWYITNCSIAGTDVVETDIDGLHTRSLTLNPWSHAYCFDYVMSVPQLRDNALEILHQCVNRCKELGIFENGTPYRQYISPLEVEEHEVSDEYKISFIDSVNKFDEMRGTDFHKTFPELKLYWELCNA